MIPKAFALLAFCLACGCGQALLLNSFEADGAVDGLVAHDVVLESARDHATDGERSLKVVFGVTTYPNVWFAAGTAYDTSDWRPYGAIVFDVFNPGEESLELSVRVDDSPEADGRVHCRQTSIAVPSRRPVTVSLAIPDRPLFMRAGPPAAETGDVTGSLASGEIDLAHITAFQFFLYRPSREHTLYFDNVRLVMAPALDRIVDRFGQYTGADWPGKVHDEAELAQRRQAEAAELETAPLPPDRDEYGGWLAGPQLEGTGWFRAEKVNGKWWLVTPTGHLFWSIGIDCVGLDNWGPIKGRQALFTWFPAPDDPLHRYGGADTENVDFFRMNVERKYGDDAFAAWTDVTRKRLKAWGFDTVGNWANWDCYRRLRIPFTAPTGTGGSATFPGAWGQIVDVYAEDWPQVAEKNILGAANAFREDPYCIGYFVDNELPWGNWEGLARYPVVFNALRLTGDRAVKKAFTALLRARYGDIARLNERWGAGFQSWEVFLAQPVDPPNRDSQAVQEDLSFLLADFAERYFSVVSALIHKHAPNQLYLGPRLCVATPEVLAAAAKYCDVISFNIYGRASNLLAFAAHFEHVDRPMIIGEFHFGALDRGMFHPGLGPVPTQEDRGLQYAEYVRTAAQKSWCVGAHWFQYVDEPLTGRFDGENYNIGFLSATDTPYPELVSHAREVNWAVYDLRSK